MSETPRKVSQSRAEAPGRADRRHGLHRPISAEGAAEARLPPARAAAPSDHIAERLSERRDRRSRAALQHGRGARRGRRGDPYRGARQHHVGRAGGRLPPVQHRGHGRLRQGRAAGAGQALRLSLLDQGAVGPDLRGHADRGARAPPHRRLWPLEARRRAGTRRRPISTGSRSGSPWSTGLAWKAIWQS